MIYNNLYIIIEVKIASNVAFELKERRLIMSTTTKQFKERMKRNHFLVDFAMYVFKYTKNQAYEMIFNNDVESFAEFVNIYVNDYFMNYELMQDDYIDKLIKKFLR